VAEKELVSQLPAIAAGVEVGFGRRWIAGAGGGGGRGYGHMASDPDAKQRAPAKLIFFLLGFL
jgi:hypothetical protein